MTTKSPGGRYRRFYCSVHPLSNVHDVHYARGRRIADRRPRIGAVHSCKLCPLLVAAASTYLPDDATYKGNLMSDALGNFSPAEVIGLDLLDARVSFFIMACTHKVPYPSIRGTCGKSSSRVRRTTYRNAAARACTWVPRKSAQVNVAEPETTRRRPPQPRLPCDPSKNVEARLALSLQRATDSRLTK